MPARHAALRDDPAALAIRLFRDGGRLTSDECAQLIGESELVIDGRAGWRLEAIDGLYLFSEWPPYANDVMPPGETTAILFRAARAICGAEDVVLDLGCGSGTLALLLSRYVARCVGTDVNGHAVALARKNAAVNGVQNVEFRAGSLWEAVGEERFDLVVSQPPYIPQPAGVARQVFLHGGHRGDELASAILAGMAEHLTPRGRGLVFSDWPLERGEDLRDRAAAPGLRARLFASPMLTLESYGGSYGGELIQHLGEMGIVGVRQCLSVCDAGSGVEEREVLPHEWAGLGIH